MILVDVDVGLVLAEEPVSEERILLRQEHAQPHLTVEECPEHDGPAISRGYEILVHEVLNIQDESAVSRHVPCVCNNA